MSTIHLENGEPGFKYELARRHGAERIMSCFACLTCVTSCPVTEARPEFSPLRVLRMVQLGLREELFSSGLLWLCTSCYACQERCPMEIRITDTITILKNMASQADRSPAGIRAQEELVKGSGRIYPLDDFDNKKRQKIELPALPTTCKAIRELFPEKRGNP
jgi:heterodisulfide reductase subunit C